MKRTRSLAVLLCAVLLCFTACGEQKAAPAVTDGVPGDTLHTMFFDLTVDAVQRLGQRVQHAGPVRREFRQLPGFLQQAGTVAIRQRGQQRLHVVNWRSSDSRQMQSFKADRQADRQVIVALQVNQGVTYNALSRQSSTSPLFY